MMRKMMMALAAVVAVSAGAATTAEAGGFGFHHGFHHFGGPRFFVGVPYGDYGSCYRRVWTPYGWRLRYICY